MTSSVWKRFFLLLFLMVSSLATSAFAGVTLSVNSVEGGSGIRFERVISGLRNTKQIQIRVSSTDGKKYQVFQRVYEPIINEKGQSLNLTAIVTGTLINSNTSGTLYLQNGEHLGFSEQLLYTSGQGGESDSFGVVYSAVPELINSSGNFRGNIVITVRALGGDQQEVTVPFVLESQGLLKVVLEGQYSPKRVRVKATDTNEEKADFIKVSFSNNGSQNIKIYQEFVIYPVNQSGEEFNPEALRIKPQGDGSAVRAIDSPISRSRKLIYSGNANEDEFAILFLVDSEAIKSVNAGVYRGQIRYTVEADDKVQEFLIDVEYTVDAVFTMDVALPPEGLSFGRVIAESPSQERQVVVTVRSNLHKPYQVVQNLSAPMTNENGKEFESKYFTFKVDLASDQKGRTKYSEISPTEVGEYPIYYSDAKGSPVVFTVTYQLKGYFDMNPGNFAAPLKFSLNQN